MRFSLPSTGSHWDWFPGFIGTMEALRFLHAPAHLVLLGAPFLCPTYRSLSYMPVGERGAHEPGPRSPLDPHGFIARREGGRSPGFLSSPCIRAPLADPDGSEKARPSSSSLLPSTAQMVSAPTTSFPFRGSVTRPTCSLCTLRRRSHLRPRNTRYRLVVSLVGWILPPLGCFEVFTCLHHVSSSQAWPGAPMHRKMVSSCCNYVIKMPSGQVLGRSARITLPRRSEPTAASPAAG